MVDEGEAWLKENEAGGGPYTIARWEIGSSYEFVRYPDYWFNPENGITPLDGMIWRIIRRVFRPSASPWRPAKLQYGDCFTVGGLRRPWRRMPPVSRSNNAARRSTTFCDQAEQCRLAPPQMSTSARRSGHAFDYDAGDRAR